MYNIFLLTKQLSSLSREIFPNQNVNTEFIGVKLAFLKEHTVKPMHYIMYS